MNDNTIGPRHAQRRSLAYRIGWWLGVGTGVFLLGIVLGWILDLAGIL